MFYVFLQHIELFCIISTNAFLFRSNTDTFASTTFFTNFEFFAPNVFGLTLKNFLIFCNFLISRWLAKELSNFSVRIPKKFGNFYGKTTVCKNRSCEIVPFTKRSAGVQTFSFSGRGEQGIGTLVILALTR